MATSLLDILQFQLGVDGNRLAPDDKIKSGEIMPADLIKLREKVSNSAVNNSYIELFEEVKQLSPELFKELTLISIYQAGFNNSPYNLFKAMPNTSRNNDGIINAVAKAVKSYTKFIKNTAEIFQEDGKTAAEMETILHKEVVDEFLRWYDSQNGHYVAQDKVRAMFNPNTPIYRQYDPETQKFSLYQIGERGFDKVGKKIVQKTRAKNVIYFTDTVDTEYNLTAANINDLNSLGVLGADAQGLLDNGITIDKLCN
jgi:hypothetical protein